MTIPYASPSQSVEAKDLAPTFTRVWMTTAASGRSTFSRSGTENTVELVENAAGRWEPTDTLTGQRLLANAAHQLISY